jgi:hypothetical protein
MARSKLEKYEIKTIHRSQINLAKYNPRFIDEKNRKQLEAGLKKHGLVETLVWNERTGNLVSGHQRIQIMDKFTLFLGYNAPRATVRTTPCYKTERIITRRIK